MTNEGKINDANNFENQHLQVSEAQASIADSRILVKQKDSIRDDTCVEEVQQIEQSKINDLADPEIVKQMSPMTTKVKGDPASDPEKIKDDAIDKQPKVVPGLNQIMKTNPLQLNNQPVNTLAI